MRVHELNYGGSMALLITALLVLLDFKMRYMKKISATRVGVLLYSTNRRIIITSISSTVLITVLLFITIPLGLDIPIFKTIYNLIGGAIIALGYCQYKIINLR